jgi:hypothetical protein
MLVIEGLVVWFAVSAGFVVLYGAAARRFSAYPTPLDGVEAPLGAVEAFPGNVVPLKLRAVGPTADGPPVQCQGGE